MLPWLRSFFLLAVILPTAFASPLIIVIGNDDLKEPSVGSELTEDSPDWDEFGDPDISAADHDLDPGSWTSALEDSTSPDFINHNSTSAKGDDRDMLYRSGVRGMFSAIGSGDPMAFEEAVAGIEASAADGHVHAHSTLGFLFSAGITRPRSPAKAFLYHHFAEDGNMQSKMALAYAYFRQGMYEEAVERYASLAEVAVSSFLISKDQPVIEPVRVHNGTEENKEMLRKYKGEDDKDFLVTEYQAARGNAGAMYKVAMFYYFGLRGVRQDYEKALYWFSKAVEKGEPRSMELLGEIYARGSGVKRNYTKALEWLMLASQQKHFSAYNGLGYLYLRGYGVEKKNYTIAKEYFEKAANNEEPGGFYNLGILYLKGIGVKKDVTRACKYFISAANVGHPKALYQVAKMFQKDVGLKKNLAMATVLYKIVAEWGPWSSLSGLALETYLKGDVGKALLLYSRMAELGYEVAQSNAAWVLDKYSEHSMCMGESGYCTDTERHLHAHSLWWQASEQGNEHAALLIGDAYYYGRGTERDYERAAEAYMHAQSQSNAQAMFNLGFMHERGQGLPYDLHLAKRYYDQALENDPAAKLPVTLALTSLWIRKNYVDSFLVDLIDSLPQIFPQVEAWVENVLMDESNATILVLLVCLLTILYLREQHRLHAAIHHQQPDNEQNQL